MLILVIVRIAEVNKRGICLNQLCRSELRWSYKICEFQIASPTHKNSISHRPIISGDILHVFIVLIIYRTCNIVFTLARAQWLSGRVLDSRPMGRGFEHHGHHCVVSLGKNIKASLVLVQPRKTRPHITERLLIGRKESNKKNHLGLKYQNKNDTRHNNFSAKFIKLTPIKIRLAKPLIYYKRLYAWWSIQSRLATLLSSLIAHRASDFRLYDGSDLKTYLLMR